VTRGTLFLAATAFGLAWLAGCGEDNGKTPDCPDLDLYDITDFDTEIPAAAIEKRNAAAAKGCVTNPGSATLPGTGGGGGAAGGGGSGGADAAAATGGSAGASAGAGGT